MHVALDLTPVTGVTRRDAVLTGLRDAILRGRLKPGDRLKEVQLSQDLGVSRPTLREAIYQLIHEGLLVQEPHRGVTVAAVDASMIQDVAVVRAALETVAAQAIAADGNGAARQALHRAYDAYVEAADGGDPVRENEAHLALHEAIWMESGNAVLRRIWPIVVASINLALTTDEVVRQDAARTRRMHDDLVRAILDNRPGDIAATVRDHIQTSAGELVELLRDREAPGRPAAEE